jgi:hypothetical protein
MGKSRYRQHSSQFVKLLNSRGNDNDLLVSLALPTSEPESSLLDSTSSIKADFRFKNSRSRLCNGSCNL